MKIGDRVFVHGYVDEIRKDTIIIRNNGGYFGTIPSEIIKGDLVRCKDCKHWAGENGERITIPVHENCYFFRADDYCSYGERGDSDDSF